MVTTSTADRQRQATDPAASAWVSANAGTGKTYVLVRRVLRILLSGGQADRILCLTFTKAAASEMSNRLFRLLASYATAGDAGLRTALEEVLGRSPTPPEMSRARTLFAGAIETPGGLKVSTIHGFCERLLQRFPLEAGLAPGFKVLDEQQQAGLLRAAMDEVLTEAANDRGALKAALDTVVTHAGEESFEGVLRSAVNERSLIKDLILTCAGAGDPITAISARLAEKLGVPGDATEEALTQKISGIIRNDGALRVITALQGGTITDIKASDKLSEAVTAQSVADRAKAVAGFFLTKKSEPRKWIIGKAVADANPGLGDKLAAGAERAARFTRDRRAVSIVQSSTALLRLADRAIDLYARRKSASGGLDYDDLIARTAGLLSSSGEAQWVLYKLDGGLDHILIDEAQDTSPTQWGIVNALAAEFFADAAPTDRQRTVFAVGDEKQSIYSFQDAAPELFGQSGAALRSAAGAAARPFADVALDESFRSTQTILSAVDAVFAAPGASAGLAFSGKDIRHAVKRLGEAGRVEIWPTEVPEEVEVESPWQPGAQGARPMPEARVAARIAQTIAGWIASGERLPSQDRPIAPGDVLILLRRRLPFAPVMIRALKAAGLPVAGADRIKVTQQIAVEDLIALGQFLLLPEDDLALASALKSPLIGLDDDDLFAIGFERRGTLWGALQKRAVDDARLADAATTLKRWRTEADFLPPFEFYSRLLDRDGRRGRLLARLGPEAGDAIDEFLNLALTYDTNESPSLQGFLAWLGEGDAEIKRDLDQGRNEVRVMTVHGAKGLEAPIVFLPDTCAGGNSNLDKLLPLAEGEPLVWLTKGAAEDPAVAEAKKSKAEAERRESHRLLYVAMTRARDRLYVAGFEGSKGRTVGCWYDLITNGLSASCQTVKLPDGIEVLRQDGAQTVPPRRAETGHGEEAAAVPLPAWALSHAPRGAARIVPLVPSKLAPVHTEEGSGLSRPAGGAPGPVPRQGETWTGDRFLRGTLLHSLLQHLPTLPAVQREKAARRFLAQRLAATETKAIDAWTREALRVISDKTFGRAFGPGSLAEVPIAAEVPLPSGPPVRIAGQIDRLVVEPGLVTVLDFKTNRPPPATLDGVPEEYLLQLSAYRLVLKRIYPAHRIEAALLWTYAPSLMPLPGEILDAHEQVILSGRPWS